jgi:hypothetical protein
LLVRLRGEAFGVDIRYPDLHRPQALHAQSLPGRLVLAPVPVEQVSWQTRNAPASSADLIRRPLTSAAAW